MSGVEIRWSASVRGLMGLGLLAWNSFPEDGGGSWRGFDNLGFDMSWYVSSASSH